MMSQSTIPIGIAVVEREGAFLIGRRGPDGPLPDLDEFPGGKCLPGESFCDCACRECFEETGLRVVAKELLLCRLFDYPYCRIELHFWHCRLADEASFVQLEFPFRWVRREDLAALSLPEANAPLVQLLMSHQNENEGR